MPSPDHKPSQVLPVSTEADADRTAVAHTPGTLTVHDMAKGDFLQGGFGLLAWDGWQLGGINPPQPDSHVENANRVPVDHFGEPLDVAGMGCGNARD